MRDVSVPWFSLRRFACRAALSGFGLTASLAFAQVPSNLLGGIDPACLPQMRAAAQECRAQVKTEGQSIADIQAAAEQCMGGKLSASCKAQLDEGKKKLQVCQGAMRSAMQAVQTSCKDKTGAEQEDCAKQIAAAELSKSPECRAALTR
jgi:hypothetical protein